MVLVTAKEITNRNPIWSLEPTRLEPTNILRKNRGLYKYLYTKTVDINETFTETDKWKMIVTMIETVLRHGADGGDQLQDKGWSGDDFRALGFYIFYFDQRSHKPYKQIRENIFNEVQRLQETIPQTRPFYIIIAPDTDFPCAEAGKATQEEVKNGSFKHACLNRNAADDPRNDHMWKVFHPKVVHENREKNPLHPIEFRVGQAGKVVSTSVVHILIFYDKDERGRLTHTDGANEQKRPPC